jgi:hypothetical protein
VGDIGQERGSVSNACRAIQDSLAGGKTQRELISGDVFRVQLCLGRLWIEPFARLWVSSHLHRFRTSD